MKKEWLEKYRNAPEYMGERSKALLAFNANIDVSKDFEELDLELEGIKADKIHSLDSEEDFRRVVKYCRDEGKNLEVDSQNFNPNIDGKQQIGGQAGIMSNFLSRLGERAIIYTPFLSEQLAKELDQEVVCPTLDNGLKLKSVEDAVNSDRTKKNYIIEFKEGSNRLILSDSIRGFGPFFRTGIEEKFDHLEEKVDYALFSGFHDVEGNFESKLRKAEKQLMKLDVPKHLELAGCSEQLRKAIINQILPKFDSLGVDSLEIQKVAEEAGYSLEENPSLGHVYAASKKIIEEFNIQRIHAHTRKFHIATAKKGYECSTKQMMNGVLLGGIAAVSMAEKVGIPYREDLKVDTDYMHVNNLDELEEFQDFFDLENFVETGTAQIEDYRVAAAPSLIHEKPNEVVGIGDIISAAAFSTEH